ncbi:hypothetical protein PS928_06299 [Pseudomonas fluorescens]|uniref:Uncharacterized protein n=1 Tax=Pseudomonas fluorescens TaxID=294 RepID=A0A5E7VU48_PSEFL|nr:hypothetical protein PS928_06299 [Pseudomonas fluorescens]
MNAGFMPDIKHIVAYVWRVSYILRCRTPNFRSALNQ